MGLKWSMARMSARQPLAALDFLQGPHAFPSEVWGSSSRKRLRASSLMIRCIVMPALNVAGSAARAADVDLARRRPLPTVSRIDVERWAGFLPCP